MVGLQTLIMTWYTVPCSSYY